MIYDDDDNNNDVIGDNDNDDDDDVDHYRPPFSGKGRLAQKGREKLNYMARQFLAEIGLSQWRSREFWGVMLMLLVVFFIRMYLHYVGQWLFLSAIGTPINK